MGITVAFEGARGYLLARIKGEWTQPAMKKTIERIVETARQRKQTRVLVDARELSPPTSAFDRFVAGQQIAAQFHSPKRIAVVYPAQFTDSFAENTAVNRGANMIVLADFGEAEKWLLEDSVE